MELEAVLALVAAHKWPALAALLIGAALRASKGDVPGPTVPAAWRAPIALGLGMVSGGLQILATGADWKTALIGGLVSGLLPIAGHDVLVEGLRRGRELGEKPLAPRDPDPPAPTGKAPPGVTLMALCLLLALVGVGCTAAQGKLAVAAGEVACLIFTRSEVPGAESMCVTGAELIDGWLAMSDEEQAVGPLGRMLHGQTRRERLFDTIKARRAKAASK